MSVAATVGAQTAKQKAIDAIASKIFFMILALSNRCKSFIVNNLGRIMETTSLSQRVKSNSAPQIQIHSAKRRIQYSFRANDWPLGQFWGRSYVAAWQALNFKLDRCYEKPHHCFAAITTSSETSLLR